ncbi:tetratricopeptide repeat protein [Nocardia sp. NPDC051321]|uniref:tetratricopeptide repeat protein n=1 Tax=Nocardia sp. NPDC051321 TaxID=3364323 RepID=UPI00378C5D04
MAHGKGAAVVTGMRGAGKTQVAAAYAREVLDHDKRGVLVGWVSADVGTVYDGLAAIADQIGVSAPDGNAVASAHRLRDYFNNHPEPHLLVLDNATDPDLLRRLLPTRGGTRIIITTTDQSMTRLADTPVITVAGYTLEQATAFLRAATNITDPTGEKHLAEELGYLPLGLAAAAAAITAPRPPLTYTQYLNKLRSQPLPRALRHREGSDYTRSTDQAIMLSVQAAEAATDDPELDTVVAWLLGLFAVLAPTGVRREMLHHSDRHLDELVDDAIERCVRYSLLNWSTGEDRLIAHRLTTRVLLERVRDTEQGNKVLSHALDVVQPHRLVVQPLRPDQHWSRRAEGADLADQIEAIRATGLATQASSICRNRTIALCVWATHQLTEAASLDRAIPFAERTLRDCEAILVPDHPFTVESRHNLAAAYLSTGRPDDAILLYERTLADRQRAHGPNTPKVFTARNNLAYAYREAGRLHDAILLYERTLADQERVLGPDHPDTLLARNNLAHAYTQAGRQTEAIQLHERTSADMERILGPDHPLTLTSHNNLAGAYEEIRRFDDAIPLYERTLADRERVLGPDDPDTLLARNNLAHAYTQAGRQTEAIQLHERTSADMERVLGPNHPNSLLSRNNLARAYKSAGRLDEAVPLFERTLSDRERILGPDNPDTLISRSDLAHACETAGDLDRAIPLYERTLADTERVLGPDHPFTLSARSNLAGAYESVGRLDDAIPLRERTLADTEPNLGPNHPDTLLAHTNLARAYESIGRLANAIRQYEHILERIEYVVGPDHQGVMTIRATLDRLRISHAASGTTDQDD